MKKLFIWFAGILADEVKKGLLEADTKSSLLKIQPGDTIIITAPGSLSDLAYERISQTVQEVFPGHKVIVLEEGLKIITARIEERPDSSQRAGEDIDHGTT